MTGPLDGNLTLLLNNLHAHISSGAPGVDAKSEGVNAKAFGVCAELQLLALHVIGVFHQLVHTRLVYPDITFAIRPNGYVGAPVFVSQVFAVQPNPCL